jgi:hypothetical protein
MEDQNQTILKRIRITWRNHACGGFYDRFRIFIVLGYGSAIGFGRLVACYVGAYGHHYGDAAVSYGELRDVS